ncbi:hypothetical protein SNE40_000276 [Patella caerulea]|uniref:Uncharacterized protein n=1 Tax=Patella caerulea TaxID=87958 RepID=A0AAN8KDH9_PATCE
MEVTGTELQNLAVVHVWDIGNTDAPLKVTVQTVDDEVKVDSLLKKICEIKDLNEKYKKHFCIISGGDRPVKKYRPADWLILPVKGLSFQKWCFNLKTEKKLISEPVIAELFFSQAKHDIASGKLKPTAEQLQTLEECLHPEFLAMDQYLSICQTLPDYCTVTIDACQMVPDKRVKTMLLTSASFYSISLSINGLKISSETGDITLCAQWYEIYSWELNKEEITLTFYVHLKHNNAKSILPFKSEQCDFMASVIMELITDLQAEDKNAPSFHISNIKQLKDGSTLWENVLFDHDKVQ